MAHHELENSGLSKMYKISPLTTNLTLAPFIGKVVRYKQSLLTKEFVRAHGTVSRDCTFMIREVQHDYKGIMRLRGYAIEYNDTFGRVLNHEHIELV